MRTCRRCGGRLVVRGGVCGRCRARDRAAESADDVVTAVAERWGLAPARVRVPDDRRPTRIGS
jgi:hypothetical protein